jgi:hypothetical protein
MDKKILLASFIFPERLDWFINYLDNIYISHLGIKNDITGVALRLFKTEIKK